MPISVPRASLSCVSASTCALLGLDSASATFLTTSDGGRAWSSQSVPIDLASAQSGPSLLPPTTGFVELDCVPAGDCTAVARLEGASGAFSLTTSDGGQTWTQGTLPTGLLPDALACTSGGDCVVTGFDGTPADGDAAYSSDGGTTWTGATLPAGAVMDSLSPSVACSGSGFCITSSFGGSPSGSTVRTSSDGGSTWAEVSASGLARSHLGYFTCPTTSDCWTSGTDVPPGSGTAVNLADAQGLLAQSADGGHAWEAAQLPSSVTAVMSVACPTATGCYAMALIGTGSGQTTFGLLSDNASVGS